MDSNFLDCPTLSAKDRDTVERRVVLIGAERAYFRWCRPGMFMMGSPEDEEGRRDDETQHEVNLTKGFWIMETPVTVGMFKVFVNKKPYQPEEYTPWVLIGNRINRDKEANYSWSNPGCYHDQGDNHPITCVSWFDAVEFCKWLSNEKKLNMRLPTEAEWEYACRAGETKDPPTLDKLLDELKKIAWISDNSGNKAHPITEDPSKAEKYHNAWHICDMIGNVREWCQDWYGEYSSDSVTDPTGPKDGSSKVLRGGSWASALENCRPAARLSHDPSYKSSYQGFRVVCVSDQL